MSRTRRFYSERPIQGATVTLAGAEAHHALQVARVRVGEEVLLFDGSGVECVGRLGSSGRGEATFEILARGAADREPTAAVSVAVSPPRGRRADFLVEKCCELGASEIIPLWCCRSVVDPRVRKDNHLSRWRRIAVEASKQCGRTRLTAIGEPASFEDVVRHAIRLDGGWICTPGVEAKSPPAPRLRERRLVLIGPEGGFDAPESALARQAGLIPLGLGPTTLRVETAAIVALVRLL